MAESAINLLGPAPHAQGVDVNTSVVPIAGPPALPAEPSPSTSVAERIELMDRFAIAVPATTQLPGSSDSENLWISPNKSGGLQW